MIVSSMRRRARRACGRGLDYATARGRKEDVDYHVFVKKAAPLNERGLR
jgi:hypothetical protein